MKKILFLIHDLGQGGAEKVLVNLVNNMDRNLFDISVTVLFGGGVNEQFLAPDIHYRSVFPKTIPGNSKLMKFFSPCHLHALCVRENYDIEVSYLEGPSARIISGCTRAETKLVSWIHGDQQSQAKLASSFRSIHEAKHCYERFDQTVCVSTFVMERFRQLLDFRSACTVKYNTVESSKILNLSRDACPELERNQQIKLISVGTLKEIKGHDRLFRVIKRLKDEKLPVCLYVLGTGPLEEKLKQYIRDNNLDKTIVMIGYETNPYRFLAKSDLFVCSSFAEGFSTAATESLIVGTPVCTVEVSGMKEMLGEHNEFGIVTENSEDGLYQGIKQLLDNPRLLAHYKEKAIERGRNFNTKSTVHAVEEMLLNL